MCSIARVQTDRQTDRQTDGRTDRHTRKWLQGFRCFSLNLSSRIGPICDHIVELLNYPYTYLSLGWERCCLCKNGVVFVRIGFDSLYRHNRSFYLNQLRFDLADWRSLVRLTLTKTALFDRVNLLRVSSITMLWGISSADILTKFLGSRTRSAWFVIMQ